MRRARDIGGVRRAVAAWRRAGDAIAFVPTMGALHRGHLSLVERARRTSDRVVVSIFVNPLQFGPHEDLSRYPRPIRRDRVLLSRTGVDLLWEPKADDLYGDGDCTRVRVEGLDAGLEGAVRPGHFIGVATVVAKLLHVVGPDVLWLGQKDGQQARILEQMVHDLRMPVRIRRGPTVRERDGLAFSSRNAYLSPAERGEAVALAHGLEEARSSLEAGERRAARLIARIRSIWKRYPRVREDYVAVVDAGSLEPVRTVKRRVMIAVAARLGRTRLIDNFEWEPR